MASLRAAETDTGINQSIIINFSRPKSRWFRCCTKDENDCREEYHDHYPDSDNQNHRLLPLFSLGFCQRESGPRRLALDTIFALPALLWMPYRSASHTRPTVLTAERALADPCGRLLRHSPV
jgi:hypothetical protein